MINRIYQNKLGITKFNKYFSYLKDIRDEIDPYIYEFFSDERKYQLRGKRLFMILGFRILKFLGR